MQGSVTYRGSAPSSLRTEIALVGTGQHVDPNDFQGRLKAVDLFDAFAGLDFKNWMVEGFVTNLFDKRIDLVRPDGVRQLHAARGRAGKAAHDRSACRVQILARSA